MKITSLEKENLEGGIFVVKQKAFHSSNVNPFLQL